MEFKTTPMLALDVAGDGDEATVESIVAVLGNTDEGGDVLKPGVFKKTLKERLPRGEIKVLWQHDRWAPPVGVVLEMAEWGKDQLPAELTKRFPDANGALYAKWQGLPTERGREVVTGIKAGALTENSIGWDPIKFTIEQPQPNEEDPSVLMLGKRIVSEARLWEFSPVNWGMNRATMNLKARAELWAEDYRLLQLADLLPNLTDLDGKAGRVLSAANLDKLKTALATLSEILLAAEPPEDDSKALTARAEALRRRIAIAERELIAAPW